MIKVETVFVMSEHFIGLLALLDVQSCSKSMAKVLGIDSKECTCIRGTSSLNNFLWSKTWIDATTIDPLAYVDDLLNRRSELLSNNKYGDFFALKSCHIEIDNHRFDYRINKHGEWESA